MMKNRFKRMAKGKFPNETENEKYSPLNNDVYTAYNEFRPEGPKPLFCYVPYNNMSFSFRGRTLACAYNQKVELGKYPENSIREMWFESEMGKDLRNHMEHNDLSYGCKHCKYFVEHGKFSGLKPLVFDRYHNYKKVRYPQVMEFELSNVCNFECVMCNGEVSSSVRKNRDHRPMIKSPYDDEFVQQLEEFIPHLKEAKFYGGEPFLIPIYFKIWERMIELNPSIRIFTITNGSVMNERVKNILEKGNFDLAVSMDSSWKGQLEAIRLNLEYDKNLKNIEYFNRYCKRRGKNLVISFTMMRINWKDFPEMIRFCNAINAAMYVSYLKHPVNFALWNLPANELHEIRESLKGETFPEGNYAERNNAQCFKDFIEFLKNAEKESEGRNPSEIVSLTQTQNRPYLELADGVAQSVGNEFEPIIDKPDEKANNLSVDDDHDPAEDYALMLSERLAEEGAKGIETMRRIKVEMDALFKDTDRNRMYHVIAYSPAHEVIRSVESFSDDELRSELKGLHARLSR